MKGHGTHILKHLKESSPKWTISLNKKYNFLEWDILRISTAKKQERKKNHFPTVSSQ